MRKTFSKKTREAIYEKYGGCCAYCGKEISYKDMQVDHSIPFAGEWYGRDMDRVKKMIEDDSINGIENLMPACRSCNFYKGGGDIESFRYKIKTHLSHTCIDSFQARLAMQFGIITYHEWDGKFYFEKIERNKQ